MIASTQSSPPLALILADDPHTDLDGLTTQCCKAMLPFAGKYRLIDFALSNCVNSGIETVGVIGQYRSRSLTAHLAYGRPWGLDRRGGLTPLLPYQACAGGPSAGIDWYTGTADAIHQNQDFVLRQRTNETLVLSASEVQDVDLVALTAQHRETGADLTVAVTLAEPHKAGQSNTLVVDLEGRVRGLAHCGSQAPGPWAVIGVLLFSTDALGQRLNEDARRLDSTHDLVGDVIPAMIEAGDRVTAFQHTGYWSKLESARHYWQASMDLLNENPELALQDGTWPIFTQPRVRPPTRISAGARVAQSLICEGCVIEGTVEHSILSPGVHVASGAVVRRAVVMDDVSIGERAWVENAILDMKVVVGPQARVGGAHRRAPTLNAPQPEPLTVVKTRESIPAHSIVGCNGMANGAIVFPSPYPWCTFDYRRLCETLFEPSRADFLHATVQDYDGERVHTSQGSVCAHCVVDASGWRAVLASSPI